MFFLDHPAAAPGRFGGRPGGSSFHNAVPTYPGANFGGGVPGFQNGPSLHKSNSAANNIGSMAANAVQPGLKPGVVGEPHFVARDSAANRLPGIPPTFGNTQPQGSKDAHNAEAAFGKSNMSIFNPSVSMNLPSNAPSRQTAPTKAPPVLTVEPNGRANGMKVGLQMAASRSGLMLSLARSPQLIRPSRNAVPSRRPLVGDSNNPRLLLPMINPLYVPVVHRVI
ncbi:unnamed protein product [Echinostoma caproni]|uniref:Uncharacterized protein n=1 Tax=Echinostoma caproni TaxID=27848 RepID=A0A3P8IB87_9TREM|nr:unnamed protein product [Echinostoma caproni]